MSHSAPDLLEMKVSAILKAHPAALEVLVEHGFAPLRQPHLRAVLANSVTLGQAMRIRSLSATAEAALLDELQALFAVEVEPPATRSGRVPAMAGAEAGDG